MLDDTLAPQAPESLSRQSSTQPSTLGRARSAVVQTESLLATVAEQALAGADAQDATADAMLRTARDAMDLDTRDRLVLLAERSRTLAEKQRALAHRLQQRTGHAGRIDETSPGNLP